MHLDRATEKFEAFLNGRPVHLVDVDFTAAKTDRCRWRLLDERGRQTWHYLEADDELKDWPQSIADKYFLGIETVCFQIGYPEVNPSPDACSRAFHAFQHRKRA